MLVGYARVSTQDQDVSLQLDALQAAGCEKVFTEKASGAQRDRPNCRPPSNICEARTRWWSGNSTGSPGLSSSLLKPWRNLGARDIGLRSLTESLDTTTSGGTLVFHLFAALAEFERPIIRERTRSGLQAARRRGRLGGRPPALSSQDPTEAKALLRDPDITVDQVATRLGVALFDAVPASARWSECRRGSRSRR